MARPVKKTTTTTKKVEEPKIEKEVKVVTDEKVADEIKTAPKASKKIFAGDDLVTCKAIAPGGTYLKGPKSGTFYSFDYEGAEEGVEYDDLARMVNTKSSYLFRPFLIVMDDDFVNEFPKLKEFYNTKYSMKNLSEILYLRSGDMKKAIESLPIGAKEAIKGLVISKIKDGSYDPSVAQTKALDEALGTQIMLVASI